jgi:hypothetical protein
MADFVGSYPWQWTAADVEHHTTINDLQQAHLDAYLSEGTTTRSTIRNFIQWRARAGIAPPFKTRYRTARTTPLTSSRQRLELIKTVAEAGHVVPIHQDRRADPASSVGSCRTDWRVR